MWYKIIPVIVGLLFLGAGCVGEEKTSTTQPTTTPNTQSSTIGNDQNENTTTKNTSTNNEDNEKIPKIVNVNISDTEFSSKTITVNVGDTVRWTNNGSNPHQVASAPHPTHTDLPGFESGIIQPGGSYSYVFKKVGSFGYHCHIHPSITGRVMVKAVE